MAAKLHFADGIISESAKTPLSANSAAPPTTPTANKDIDAARRTCRAPGISPLAARAAVSLETAAGIPAEETTSRRV